MGNNTLQITMDTLETRNVSRKAIMTFPSNNVASFPSRGNVSAPSICLTHNFLDTINVLNDSHAEREFLIIIKTNN